MRKRILKALLLSLTAPLFLRHGYTAPLSRHALASIRISSIENSARQKVGCSFSNMSSVFPLALKLGSHECSKRQTARLTAHGQSRASSPHQVRICVNFATETYSCQ